MPDPGSTGAGRPTLPGLLLNLAGGLFLLGYGVQSLLGDATSYISIIPGTSVRAGLSFLDVFHGAAVLAGLCFLVVFVLGLVKLVRARSS